MYPAILELPFELLFLIFTSLDSLSDVHALARTCSFMHEVFKAGPSNLLYDAVLRRTMPAYADALRAVRAAATAFDYLIDLGFDKETLAIAQPPQLQQALANPVQRCHYDITAGQYINVPSTAQIIKLGQSPLANEWEVRCILTLRQLVRRWFKCARSSIQKKHRRLAAQEECFFRGAFRLQLFGYLFYPGVYHEPLFNELELLSERLYEDHLYPYCLEIPRMHKSLRRYPVYVVSVDKYFGYSIEERLSEQSQELEKLFGGFVEWIIEDGQRRGREGFSCRRDSTSGGMRELELLREMFSFLEALHCRDVNFFVPIDYPLPDDHWPLCILGATDAYVRWQRPSFGFPLPCTDLLGLDWSGFELKSTPSTN